MALIKNLTESLDTSCISPPSSALHLELHKQSVNSPGPCYANLAGEVKRGNVLVVQRLRLERQDALLQSGAKQQWQPEQTHSIN